MMTGDPATFLKISMAGSPPGVWSYFVARASLARRLVADAADSADTVVDIGPGAFPMLGQAVQSGTFERGEMLLVGIALGDEWVRWAISTAPVEPVPGSPSDAASRN